MMSNKGRASQLQISTKMMTVWSNRFLMWLGTTRLTNSVKSRMTKFHSLMPRTSLETQRMILHFNRDRIERDKERLAVSSIWRTWSKTTWTPLIPRSTLRKSFHCLPSYKSRKLTNSGTKTLWTNTEHSQSKYRSNWCSKENFPLNAN